MNVDTQLAIAALGLLVGLAVWLGLVLRFAARLDRRRPPTPARGIGAQIVIGETLPSALLARVVGKAPAAWPAMAAIFALGESCEPCDQLAPEVLAASRDYGEFFFYIDGRAPRRHRPGNVAALERGSVARELGVTISPALVIALGGVVHSVALVNAGGQVEAALRSAIQKAGGAQ